MNFSVGQINKHCEFAGFKSVFRTTQLDLTHGQQSLLPLYLRHCVPYGSQTSNVRQLSRYLEMQMFKLLASNQMNQKFHGWYLNSIFAELPGDSDTH